MMPGVGFDRGAFRVVAETDDTPVKKFFHDHHHDEDDKVKGAGARCGRKISCTLRTAIPKAAAITPNDTTTAATGSALPCP